MDRDEKLQHARAIAIHIERMGGPSLITLEEDELLKAIDNIVFTLADGFIKPADKD